MNTNSQLSGDTMFLYMLVLAFTASITSSKHSGKSATNRESNHGSGVCKEHYALYYVPKTSILFARTGAWKISSVACGFSSINIDYSNYSKYLISKINEVYVIFN